jgi:hypothetical protein
MASAGVEKFKSIEVNEKVDLDKITEAALCRGLVVYAKDEAMRTAVAGLVNAAKSDQLIFVRAKERTDERSKIDVAFLERLDEKIPTLITYVKEREIHVLKNILLQGRQSDNVAIFDVIKSSMSGSGGELYGGIKEELPLCVNFTHHVCKKLFDVGEPSIHEKFNKFMSKVQPSSFQFAGAVGDDQFRWNTSAIVILDWASVTQLEKYTTELYNIHTNVMLLYIVVLVPSGLNDDKVKREHIETLQNTFPNAELDIYTLIKNEKPESIFECVARNLGETIQAVTKLKSLTSLRFENEAAVTSEINTLIQHIAP